MANFKEKKCIYCNNDFTPRTGNQKTCGSEECQQKLHLETGMKQYYRRMGTKPKEKPTKKTVKNKSVCEGCKYHIEKCSFIDLNGSCDFENQTGRSRLKIEIENGGYRTDACVCYVAGDRRGRKVQPY